MLGPLHLAYVFLGCAKETGIQSLWASLPLASVSSVTSNKPARRDTRLHLVSSAFY